MNRIDSSTLLFFDASCLIAAAASPSGGSGFLWSLCEQRRLIPAVSQAVLMEVEVNLAAKFSAEVQDRHIFQVRDCAPVIARVPPLDVRPRLYPEINTKAEHVVAAALDVRAAFIITLNQPLRLEINHADLGVQAVLPGVFIREMLLSHAEIGDSSV